MLTPHVHGQGCGTGGRGMSERAVTRQSIWDSHQRTILAVALMAAVVAVVGIVWGRDIWLLLSSEEAVETLVARAGIWGPVILVVLGALQVVVAPIPGYAVGLAAGYLYGPLWGGLYAAAGMLLGGMTAMWLGRTFGRPGVQWIVGAETLARWESVTHSNSPFVWFFLLLGPMGDVPFLLAGLSSVPYIVIFLLALLIRVPSIFLSTAIGGGLLSPVWMVVALAFASIVVVVAWRYRTPWKAWYERQLRAHIEGEPAPALQPAPVDSTADDTWSPPA